jgi:PKD repeat protein
VFIVKYDSDGNALWAKNAGGTDNDYAFSVAADPSNNSYVTGFFFSPTITFGSVSLTNAGSYDMFIVKYDASGNVLWAKNSGGYSIAAQSIAADPAGSGDSYVTGYFSDTTITFGSTILTNSNNNTSSDIFLVKYDEDGNVQWAKSAKGINPDQAFSVAADAYGDVYVAGYFSSPTMMFDSTTLSLVSYYDMFIAKIGDTTLLPPVSAFLPSDTVLCEKFCIDFTDQSLNNPVSWQWIFEGGNPSTSSDQNPTTICYETPGTFDVTLITTNANGISDTLTLNNYITVNANPFAPTITQSGNTLTSSSAPSYQWYLNGYLIPGATDQNYTITQAGLYTVEVSNENGCKSQSSFKAYLVGIESLTGDNGIFIFPNPSEGSFVLECTDEMMSGSLKIEVLNSIGQQVFSSEEQMTSSSFKKEMNLGQLAEGIYFIEVKTDDLILKKKIMILR